MASGVRPSRCLSSLVCLDLFPALASGFSILGGVAWLSGCLSVHVFLHVSPALASGIRLSGRLLFAFTWLPSFFLTVFLPLPTHVSSIISLPYSGGV